MLLAKNYEVKIVISKIKNIFRIKERTKVYTLILLFVGLVLLLIAYLGMRHGIFIGELNQPIMDWMLSHRQTQITGTLRAITAISEPQYFALTVFAATAAWSIISKEMRRPILLSGAIALSAITSVLSKLATANLRPSEIFMMTPLELDFSFPSGHAISTFVVLSVLGYLIFSRQFNKWQLMIWSVFSVISLSLVSISRLYLGYHWTTDVIASIGLGMIILSIVILIDKKIKNYLPEKLN